MVVMKFGFAMHHRSLSVIASKAKQGEGKEGRGQVGRVAIRTLKSPPVGGTEDDPSASLRTVMWFGSAHCPVHKKIIVKLF